jgi:hypothetical protein
VRALYTALVCLFIRWAVRFTLARGRVVHYTHGGRLYMTRYALWGHLTGDGQSKARRWFPNLYVHQMHAPDLDPSLHDHPWPWAVSLILLGGYREERNAPGSDHQLEKLFTKVWRVSHWRRAPGLNRLSGGTFHRVAELDKPEGCPWCWRKGAASGCPYACSGRGEGVWTLFLAGPGRSKKPWGYIVEGRGYVSHQERHNEIEGKEVREPKLGRP